jgi:predicted DCC family thiol-disulfide oxidoreductase YuxK
VSFVVWYNTRCPVCDAGIARQKRRLIAAVKAGAIEFRDINYEPDVLARYGATLDEIWRRTPGDAWLAALTGHSLVRPITRFAYDRFADLLYAWNRRRGHW